MKKYLTATLSLAALTASVYFTACKSKKEATTAPATTTTPAANVPTYTADIKQILDANCAKTCHSAENHKHNIDLSSYDAAKSIAGNKSFLGSVNHQDGFDPMPAKAPKLDDAVIAKLTNWVKNGMPK